MERAWSPETATPQPATPRSGLPRFVLEVALFLTLTLAIPLAAEVVLRGLDLRPGTAVFQPALDGGRDRVVRLARHPYSDRAVPIDPQREFRLEKPANTLRVFVIGESVAAGVPYGLQFAFASWLAQRLAVETTGVQWEVVNAALGGLQSRGALTIVREIARYQPDLLIVYHGHNETATRFSAADRLWLNPHSLRSRLVESRLYEVLSSVLPASATSRLVAPRDAGRPGRVTSAGRRNYPSRADRRLSAALFEARLVEIVRLMHGAGARTMLLTLSQNFSEWAPAIAVHRTGMRPDELAAWRAAVRAGDQLAPRDCVAALAAWSQALAIDPDFADLEFRMAQCEQTLRRLEEANIRFRRASDLDRLPHGAPTAFNDILRDVARREDAILVDVDAAFLRASGPRLVGNDLFVEAVHLNIRGQQLIATVLAEAIRAARIGAPEVQWDPDAYIEPSPDAVLAADPGLAGLEKLLRAVVCAGAGRPGCKTTFSGTDIDAPD